MGLSDIYHSLEGKWYAFWDKIDTKIPVHGALDAVDSVIPSFLLFLMVIILLIIFGAYFFVSANQVYSASFTINTSDNQPVNDTLIFANLVDGQSTKELSQRTDADGKVTFTDLRAGQELDFNINLSRGSFSGSYPITGDLAETIHLQAPTTPISLEPVRKRISLKTLSGLNITGPVQLKFSCSQDASLAPDPAGATYTPSMSYVEVSEPAGCGLTATVTSTKYKQKTYSVDSLLYPLYLEDFEPPASKVTIKVRSGGYPVSDASFTVRLTGNNTYTADTKATSEVTFDSVDPGQYNLSVSDSANKYGIVSESFTVPSTGITQVVNVSKTIVARVTVTVLDDASGYPIEDAMVKVKDPTSLADIADANSDSSGNATFVFTDLGTYVFSAKKPGDVGEAYFVKEVTQELTGDASITMRLTQITNQNAGKTVVHVTDQDGLPVVNAKVMLKYKGNDGIVELLQANNYSYTDTNGEADMIAGQVDGAVYAYAIKGPFYGSSTQKAIAVDSENDFTVQMSLGIATIKVNLTNEAGASVDGTAEIMPIDGITSNPHGISGLVSVEGGQATRQVKAGQSVYVRLKADGYEDYYSVPLDLLPNQTYPVNVMMIKQVLSPDVNMGGIFNENDQAVQTMAPGKRYYAKLTVSSDSDYGEVLLHFRAGKETEMANDVIQIDSVEAANVDHELRGVSFDQNKGYSYDGQNTTDGPSKWINVYWENPGRGIREVKVWFRITRDATPNREIQFFYRGEFDNTRVPPSIAQPDLYADAKSTRVYYVGAESICDASTAFCINSEWFKDQSQDLYLDPPYEMKNLTQYTYHFTLLNNSGIDYGTDKKPVYMSITVLGDDSGTKRVKINDYQLKDSISTKSNTSGKALYEIDNIQISSFEKNTTIDTMLNLEAVQDGAEAVLFELKADGKIIYSKETSFSVVKEKDFAVTIDPQFIPALMNTNVVVTVLDEKGQPLEGATVTSYAKEPGFDELQIDSTQTNRLGKATVQSGALFQSTQSIIEVQAAGYSRQRFVQTVSPDAITFSPSQLFVQLNTYTTREDTKDITFDNLTTQDLVLKSISMDAKLRDVINEDAMNAYFDEIAQEERTIKAEDTLDLTFLKMRLMDNITQNGFIEPIKVNGSIVATFEQPASNLSYDVNIPVTLNVSSQADPGADCLEVKTDQTTAVTEHAQVTFNFEITNACVSGSNNTPIALDALSVVSDESVSGIAQVAVMNTAGLNVGRVALSGTKRVLVNSIAPGEKLLGTVTFAPNQDAIGKAIPLRMSFEAKFQDQIIKSNPDTITFTANVDNLKDCLSIQSDTAPVANDGKAKVRIDATNCLDQKIAIYLCKGDSKCTGDAPGGVTLSASPHWFYLQNKVQDIDVFWPVYPGTYGITVYARSSGSTGWDYIGDFPVSFKERVGSPFSLQKYELNLVGDGTEDRALLTNKRLSTTVNVTANACVFGKKDAPFNWGGAVGGALLGAMVGNIVGNYLPNNAAMGWVNSKPASTSPSGGYSTVQPLKLQPTMSDQVYDQVNSAFLPTPNVLNQSNPLIPQSTGWLPTTNFSITGTNGVAQQAPDESTQISKAFFSSAPEGVHTAGQAQEAHFAEASSGGGNYLAAFTTVAFAVIGGMLLGQGTYKCADDLQTVPYTGFTTLLQGTTISVNSPAGNPDKAPVEQTVPSDAGALTLTGTYTGGKITPSWDFNDAHYSNEEQVALKFVNDGNLSDIEPRYGTLRIDYTMHLYSGVIPAPDDATVINAATSQAFCSKPTFGNYWIGPGEDAGLCRGVSTRQDHEYYHLRVISAEPQGEDAYIQKANSCYMGALTGATGEDALPRVKLSWNWDDISADSCDYGNPNFSYCDATQFTIALAKKLSALDNFMQENQSKFTCPANPMEADVQSTIDKINNADMPVIPNNFIGIESADVTVGADDTATAKVVVLNNTGSDAIAMVSSGWSGNGGIHIADGTDGTVNSSFPTGRTTLTFKATAPKYEGMYYFMATINGPSVYTSQVRRAFTNRDTSDTNCWIPQTTRKFSGLPGLSYYVQAEDSPSFTSEIPDSLSLYNSINFGVYLTKDAFSENFFKDFRQYYMDQVFTGPRANSKEAQIVDYLASGNFTVVKKFSGESAIEPGLYDVWINLDAPGQFRVLDGNNTSIEVDLLLVKKPSIDSPFYSMPFDGVLGQAGGRQGYGSIYTNENENDVLISNNGIKVNTFYNAASNGVMSIDTKTKTTFDAANTAIETRARLGSVSLLTDNSAEIVLTPNFATPIISKYTLNETSGTMAFALQNKSAIGTSGNLSYWTGAAKSKDFFGGSAVETYLDSPDYRLDKLGNNVYGFQFDDISRKGTMFLKSVFFTPADGTQYNLAAQTNNVSFWTPAKDFSAGTELKGIPGMQFNSQADDSYIKSIQDLFDAVKNEQVCMSSDGASTSFWWNPSTLEQTAGPKGSLNAEETALVGTS